MAGEVSARGVSGDEVLFLEKGLGAGVVAGGKVHLRQPEGVFVVVCRRPSAVFSPCLFLTAGKDFTGQRQQLVADKDSRIILALVQSILAPVPEELLHAGGAKSIEGVGGIKGIRVRGNWTW